MITANNPGSQVHVVTAAGGLYLLGCSIMWLVQVHQWCGGAVKVDVAPCSVQGQALMHHNTACQRDELVHREPTACAGQPCAR